VSEKSQVKVYLPEELHTILNADQRSNSEAVEAALWEEYGGENVAAIDKRIKEKQKRKTVVKDELEGREDEIAELDDEIQNLQSKKEDLEPDTEQHWQDAVGNIEPPTHLAEHDTLPDRDEWEPPVDNQKVQIYADRLGIEPEEFSTQFPEKWSEYNDN